MKIHCIYKFKLTDSANRLYAYVSNAGSYSVFSDTTQLEFKQKPLIKSIQTFELRIITNQSAKVILKNSKYGIGYFDNSDDVLLIKKTIDKLGYLYIYVLKDMKPYIGIVFQLYLEGYFNAQIRHLKSSLSQ
nr:hypothetical protein [uncultured Draconibacterium sp.]